MTVEKIPSGNAKEYLNLENLSAEQISNLSKIAKLLKDDCLDSQLLANLIADLEGSDNSDAFEKLILLAKSRLDLAEGIDVPDSDKEQAVRDEEALNVKPLSSKFYVE